MRSLWISGFRTQTTNAGHCPACVCVRNARDVLCTYQREKTQERGNREDEQRDSKYTQYIAENL